MRDLGHVEGEQNADMFDEDFGKMKMEGFRERCRNILGGLSSHQS